MKINIELNIPDGRTFLNFWDYMHGNDVICEVVDGKLMLGEYDSEGNELPAREITFQDFINKVVEQVKNQADD